MDAFEANLRIWQALGDTMSEMNRRRQDSTLQSIRERLPASSEEARVFIAGMSPTAPLDSVRADVEKADERAARNETCGDELAFAHDATLTSYLS